MNFFGLLVDKGVLPAGDRSAVEAELAKGRPLADVLAEHGVSLAETLAEVGGAYGIPSRVLGDPPVAQEAFSYIPIDSARHYGFVPLAVAEGVLEVGITDPDNIEALDARIAAPNLGCATGKVADPCLWRTLRVRIHTH